MQGPCLLQVSIGLLIHHVAASPTVMSYMKELPFSLGRNQGYYLLQANYYNYYYYYMGIYYYYNYYYFYYYYLFFINEQT